MQEVYIRPVFSKPSPRHFWKIKHPVQGMRFDVFLVVENIGSSVLLGMKISGAKFRSAEKKEIVHSIDKEFLIGPMNPGGKTMVWIDRTSTDLCGVAWLDFQLTSTVDGEDIQAYQNTGADKPARCVRKNMWEDSFIVDSGFEHGQQWTNKLLLVLTGLALFQSGIPFASIFKSIAGVIGSMMSALADLFTGLSR